MADVSHGYNWTNVGTIGTTVLSNQPTVLVRVVLPGTYVGTVIMHDSASATGTSTTSPVYTLPIPTINGPVSSIEIGAQCKNGLTIEATGTPTATIIWGN